MVLNSRATLALIFLLAFGSFAPAQIITAHTWQGIGNWSIDGGNVGTPMTINVPAGSTVERAFLYCSTALGTPAPAGVTPVVVMNGMAYGPLHFTALPFANFGGGFSTGMQAYRADVTAQVSSVIGTGGGSPFIFTINDHSNFIGGGNINGEGLVVVYSNPAERHRNIALFDGGQPATGTSFSYTLPQQINTAIPGFEALVSAGIGFSSGTGSQLTQITVNGRVLTSGAGGGEDGGITIGGVGDNPTNPLNPLSAGPDDELYNLALGNGFDPAPFVMTGDSVFNFTTFNSSGDDNLFFMGLNVVTPVPEPTSLVLLSLAIGTAGFRRLKSRNVASRRPVE